MLPIYAAIFVVSMAFNTLIGNETGLTPPTDLAFQTQSQTESCEGCPARSEQVNAEQVVLQARAP